MHNHRFWPEIWRDDNGLSQLLLPFAFLWNAVTKARMGLATPWRAPVPVICVGNLVVGGAGKTPLAIALARHLMATDHTPHFLSRGYGGRESGPVQVDLRHHNASTVGDEPLLLAAVAPTWVARNRAAGARMACAAGAEMIIMDDGFQNPSLAKDISVLAIDGGYGFGNHRVMPAGPLRERLSSGLQRADAAVVIGTDATGALNGVQNYCPVHKAHLTPYPDDAIAGKRVLAFAGIGRPEKFYATLRQFGCTVAATRDFPDHHPFTPEQIIQLCEDAAALDAVPVTTEKDHVRLHDDAKVMVHALRVELEWADLAAADQILEKIGSDG
jgi:tetraacyldisaccharide 4'-kinase